MNIGKFCDYLYDTGIIDIESIDNFSEIHKKMMMKNNSDNNKSENKCENVKLTLSSYLSQKLNSKQSFNKFSQNIIKSFSQNLLINRYLGIKLLYSILFSKIRSRYINFFSKINIFIFNKNYNGHILENKKGRIIKNNNFKKNNNDNNKNNERKLNLNFDYDLNKKPIPLDHNRFLKSSNNIIKTEKENNSEEEEKKKEMEQLKIARKTFIPGIGLYSKEICEQKNSEENHEKYWNKNYLNKISPKKRKVNFHSLEKKRLEEIHKKYIVNKLKKEKKEKRIKEKEDKKKMELRDKFKNIYEEKISTKEYIDRLYLRSIKKPESENNVNDNKKKEKKISFKKYKKVKSKEKINIVENKEKEK